MSWFFIFSLIISSITFLLLATKYSLDHKCCPQNCLFNSSYPIATFLMYFLLYTAPAYLRTNVAVQIPAGVCDYFPRRLPIFPLRCSDSSSGQGSLSGLQSVQLSPTYGILLSILKGILYHVCNEKFFYDFPLFPF